MGIGTAAPTQKLEVAGQVFSNAGGFRFPDNTVQATAAATTPATTASNGLTKTGNNIALGGLLSQATTISQAGNTFSLMNSGLGAATLDQQQLVFDAGSGGAGVWQSFTVGASGSLTQLDLRVSSPTGANGAPGTLSVYAGQGISGTLLTAQAIVYNNVINTYQQYPLSAPVAVVAGQQYTYYFQTPTTGFAYVDLSNANPYAGGRAIYSATGDLCFKTYVSPTVVTDVLTALAGGSVGIGTAAPTQKLEVAGQVFSSTGGFRFPDNTVQATAAATTPATTASNGLTITGNNIALGGPLSQPTTIAQAGNTFSLTGGNVGIGTSSPAGLLTVQGSALGAGALDQQQPTSGASTSGTDHWQSFTAGTSGTLTRLDMLVSSPTGANGAPGTLSIYAGEGTGGALLSTQAIAYNNGFSYQAFPLATPAAVVAGQQYTYRFQTPSSSQSFAQFSFANPYAGGRASFDATWDWCFKTYVAPTLSTNVLTALTGGNVGIGTATPGAQLHVAGNMKIDGANTLEFGAGVSKEINAGKIGYQVFSTALDIVGAGTSGTDRKIKFWAEGGAVFTGSVTGVGAFNTSDRRFKQHIRPLGGALASVLALRGVRYEWNALGQQHGGTAGAGQVGLIAQEIEKIYPELVSTGADGYKAVNYAQLAPVLIEALKELKAEHDALKARAATSEAKAAAAAAQATVTTDAFEARLRALEASGGQARK